MAVGRVPPGDPLLVATGAGPGDSPVRQRSDLVLLLITVVLVVAGLVLLLVGYVQSSMTILYASIGSAALAGVVLIAYSRLNRRREVEVAVSAVGPGAAGPVSAGPDAMGTPAAGSVATGSDAADPDAMGTPAAGSVATGRSAAGFDAEPTAAVREPGPVGDQSGEEPTP